MTRNLHADTEAAVAAEIVTRAMAVELDFATGVVRLNTTTDTLTIDGDDYLPSGILGTLGAVEESAELASTVLRMALSGIPRDMAGIALVENYQNRPARVWEVVFDPDTLEIEGDPVLLFAGRMDVMRLKYSGDTCTIELDVTNRLVDWERPRRVLFSDEQQRRAHPGDTSFRYAASLAERTVVWPAAEAFKKGIFST